MKKFFKILMITTGIVAAFLLPVIIAVAIGAPALNGFLLSLSVLSLILFIMLLRAFWLRWREKRFINGILEQDKDAASSADKQLSGELSKRWKEAMRDLKKSHLKNMGNPLYVLPWYMIIGESGSGKTTALKNSRLTSKFASPKVSGISGTKNCDWWFFEQAIVIDTAGRYAIHQDDVSDRDEWRLFLSQLAKYRKKEPLNGLIVSISADKLLRLTPDELEEEGQKIRVRIEELMQSLGAKFPVYVLVTKSDLVYGMQAFCDMLPPKAHDQAFGFLNKEASTNALQIVEETFKSLAESIGNYRLRLSNVPGNVSVEPEVLLFPEEFAMLKKGLKQFIEAAFNKSIYQESPFLRGLYFTSGRQSGKPSSHFIKNFGFKQVDKKGGNSNKSYFLYDFFAKILPADRGVFSLTGRAIEWQRKIKTMKLSAFAVSVLTLCGFLSWSFGINIVTIKKFQNDFSTPPVLSGELLKDVNTFENFKASIIKIEKQNTESWLPNFGLDHCKKIEKELKKAYCNYFINDFLLSYDKKMTESMVEYSEKTPLEIVGRTIPHYIKRINLLEASLITEGPGQLVKTPMPDFKVLVIPTGHNVIPKSLELLGDHYFYYLLWADNNTKTKEIKRLKSRLEFITAKKDISLNWLVAWCNENGADSVTLKDFWFGKKTTKETAVINPAYTVKGSEKINAMLVALEKALDNPLMIEKKKIVFRQWYIDTYMYQWLSFGRAFKSGPDSLGSDADKMDVVKRMAVGKGPYISLISRMAVELEPCIDSQKELPVWVKQIFELDEIKKYAARISKTDNKSVVGSIAKKGLKLFGKAGKLASGVKSKKSGSDSTESLMVTGDYYNRYIKGLAGISQVSISPLSSFTLAKTVFGEDPATAVSPVFSAQTSFDGLLLNMQTNSNGKKFFANLLKGPFDYLWGYVCKNTGSHIQQVWDETVLSEVEGVFDAKVMSDMLFGESGYVKKFTSGDIAPFISRSRKKGYYAKTSVGEKIPFSKEFFTYLTRGAFSVRSEKTSYKVKIKGLPTDTNPGAKLIPHVTKLELSCAEGGQLLENYNYPVNRTFEWSPTDCGDVILTISIGHLVLEKKYTGFRPFAKFLKAFSKGRHTFYRKEFPEKIAALKRMGIKYIKVKYNISGGRPVIRLLNMAAGNAPEVIVNCSD